MSSPSYGKPTSPAGAVSTMGSSSSENTVTADERPTHIAFGKKVTIPDHILGSKQVQNYDVHVPTLVLQCSRMYVRITYGPT